MAPRNLAFGTVSMMILCCFVLVAECMTANAAGSDAAALLARIAEQCSGYRDQRMRDVYKVDGRYCDQLGDICAYADKVRGLGLPGVKLCAGLFKIVSSRHSVAEMERCVPSSITAAVAQTFQQTCVEMCSAIGGQSLPRAEALSLVQRLKSVVDIKDQCLSAWTAGLPPSAKSKLAACTPEVLRVLDQIQNGGMVKLPTKPSDLEIRTAAEFFLRYALPSPSLDAIAALKSLLEQASGCIDATPAAKLTIAALVAHLGKATTAILNEQERIRRQQAFQTAVAEKAAPRIKAFVSCPRCTAATGWAAFELVGTICTHHVGVKEREAEIRQIRRYGRRHGVVDLKQLHDLSDDVRTYEAEMKGAQEQLRQLRGGGGRFSVAKCSRLSALSAVIQRIQREEASRLLPSSGPTESSSPSSKTEH